MKTTTTRADEIRADIAELQVRLARADEAYKPMLRGWIWLAMADLAAVE